MTATFPPGPAGETAPPDPEPILLEAMNWDLREQLFLHMFPATGKIR